MEKKPFGSDFDFYDGEWIFPFAFLGLATLFVDYEMTKQIMIIMFVIVCAHTVHEHKIAFGKKNIWMRGLYAFLGFLSGFLFYLLPLIYTIVSYSLCTSKLKTDNEEILLTKKRKTYVTMLSILVFACCMQGWKNFVVYNSLLAEQAQQNQPGQAGTISQ